jgi:hypothetical protein
MIHDVLHKIADMFSLSGMPDDKLCQAGASEQSDLL